ncbi:MAG: DUF86 domain-containing protein [Alphaproteobacteria bacterium]|nr:DUF86 domain-containing protein [Alphaproteobacteria bacterium]
MSEKPLLDYIEHIQKAATDACSFVEGITKAEFLEDRRSQQAVIMCLVIIGDASTKLMNSHAEFLTAHAGVPWQKMRGMHNRIAHGYFDIDINIVWDTVQTALPELLKQLPSIALDARDRDLGDDGMQR